MEPPIPTVSASKLFGFDPTPGVVAVEASNAEARLTCALARESGGWSEKREFRTVPFRPWLLVGEAVESIRDLPGLRGASFEPLDGDGLRIRVRFSTWTGFLTGRDALRERGVPMLVYSSPEKQFLMDSGITLFKEMDFDSTIRMQVDLETTGLKWGDPTAQILLIAVGDNRGHAWGVGGRDERALLREFVELVASVDPDIIEGHNLFGFDLPYLHARAAALGVSLTLGRDGSTLRLMPERHLPVGGMTRSVRTARIWGRHLLDTLPAVQRWDVGRGELVSHALKSVAQHFSFAPPDRVYLDRSRIFELWDIDPERVRTYAAQDIEETRRLAELVLPTEFYQAQMVPESYQAVALGGTGEKINSLLIRDYLHRGCAVPLPQPPSASPGGYTEIRRTGVLRRVIKADVESLYPSIMLHDRIRPASDHLDVFLPMLGELTRRRLDAKSRSRSEVMASDRNRWDGIQASFKILINSFYGYLGAPFHFNDHRAAARVTTKGQELVKRLAAELERTGSEVIEIDTDGVYFVGPESLSSEADEQAYVAEVGRVLPAGIRLAHDGRYAAMLSLKVKNYVLEDYHGRRIFKGASLRSRSDEGFGRKFMEIAVDAILRGEPERLAAVYRDTQEALLSGNVSIDDLCRRERVTEKTLASPQRRKSRDAARGAAVGDTITVYHRSDGTLGLRDAYANDEDRWHYVEKLHKFASRFEEVLGADFAIACPKPVRRMVEARLSGQGTLF